MKILWRQQSACTNSRKTSPASLYYPTNTVQKSTLNGQTSKLTFGNNVSLKDINYPNPEECGWQVEENSIVPD